MDIKHFEYSKKDSNVKIGNISLTDEDGNIIKFSNFKKESSFYIHIPSEKSIKSRN